MTRIAVLGLGEAGRRYARGLARAGAEVRGFDPAHDLEGIVETLVGADDAEEEQRAPVVRAFPGGGRDRHPKRRG